ncbi:hypothetical protein Tdes44962_MAKER08553 [Teratosphaeria destructans]|uniref:Uncharacterized protein n=1 Tax=Teratosphaeria destructans TaxID=418781 RepID=A0A9W7W4S2_9PEZI|nr:hypothetical protein Tdes44962_MAKER08553 [Teratosphaeria destructans]
MFDLQIDCEMSVRFLNRPVDAPYGPRLLGPARSHVRVPRSERQCNFSYRARNEDIVYFHFFFFTQLFMYVTYDSVGSRRSRCPGSDGAAQYHRGSGPLGVKTYRLYHPVMTAAFISDGTFDAIPDAVGGKRIVEEDLATATPSKWPGLSTNTLCRISTYCEYDVTAQSERCMNGNEP